MKISPILNNPHNLAQAKKDCLEAYNEFVSENDIKDCIEAATSIDVLKDIKFLISNLQYFVETVDKANTAALGAMHLEIARMNFKNEIDNINL